MTNILRNDRRAKRVGSFEEARPKAELPAAAKKNEKADNHFFLGRSESGEPHECHTSLRAAKRAPAAER